MDFTYSAEEKKAGTQAVNYLSELARQGYRDADTLTVYKTREGKFYIADDDGDVTGIFSNLKELENYLETLAVDDDDMDADEISALLACETWKDALEYDIYN